MTKTTHRIYIGTLAVITIAVTIYLTYIGLDYYQTPLEERFYHESHHKLRPSGPFGHGLGILGSFFMMVGVFGYQARKYMKSLSKVGVLKYWLEFHIFLCTLGPIMVLFHTSFKVGGLVSVSFWSMIAVVASGVLGRFIYLQIPRTIQGRELSLGEIDSMKEELSIQIEQEIGKAKTKEILKLADRKISAGFIGQYIKDRSLISDIRQNLLSSNIKGMKLKHVMALISNELNIGRKIERLVTMQKYFKYWHVAHLPFAIIMLVIMLVHVAVTLALGYKWVF